MPASVPASVPQLTVAVVIASLGRPDILVDAIEDLRRQSQPADRILLSVTCADDLPDTIPDDMRIEQIIGPKGSCLQRNTALDRLDGACDLVAFWDDDYVPSCFAIERIASFFAANTDVAGACGFLLADGVNGPAIAIDAARAMLVADEAAPAPPPLIARDVINGLYGCNMVFRTSALRELRFDERLRLYGWQEDIDLSARVRPRGRIVRTFAFTGVHRGTKGGRSPGIRVGYSQVVNPYYLVRKGTMRWRYAAKIALRNMVANHARIARPEQWIDRAGRAKGNWLGLADLVRGRVTPERVEQL